MQGCGWLPLTLSGNTSGRFLCCFYPHTLNRHHLLLEKKASIYSPRKTEDTQPKGQGVQESQRAVTFYESARLNPAKQVMWLLSLPGVFSTLLLFSTLHRFFFFFIQSPCTSHSLSSHLLGLCKYCHSEILRALIDCGWGLIIRSSYKDIFHKIDATKRETKSLQWGAPLFFFFYNSFFFSLHKDNIYFLSSYLLSVFPTPSIFEPLYFI